MEKNYFAHPSSCIDLPCQIGEGTKIWHFSHIMAGSEIGKRCVIGQNVVISPGVKLGDGVKIQNNVSVYTGVDCEDGVFLGPSCVFTNVINPRAFIERKNEFRATPIGRGASIGANVTIVCGHRIGRYALIGAGAVVTHDIPDYALAYGSPARVQGYVCQCGSKLEFQEGHACCPACKREYEKTAQGVRPAESDGRPEMLAEQESRTFFNRKGEKKIGNERKTDEDD